ncbi:MAG: hypothetical protein HRK26_03570 [Rickettsiaceae bacterium H1]|nr:hypothetical protein [Rickettsiaceae bacterium H1]
MLFNILIPIIKKSIQITNVYYFPPKDKALPYAILKNTKNKNWENLVEKRIESIYVCEIHTDNINLEKLLQMTNKTEKAISNSQLLLKLPEIIFLNFDNYKIERQNSILISYLYFNVLVSNQ